MTLLALLVACGTAEPSWSEAERATLERMALRPAVRGSPGNPRADDRDAAVLGQHLFFDPGLGDGVSCASCHRPDRAFTDGLPRAIGVSRGARNTPTLLGAAHQTFLTWDGRKDSLWSQALEPLEAEAEQGSSRLAVVRHVARHHRRRFEAVFGALPADAWFDALPQHARPVGDPSHPHDRAWRSLPPSARAVVDAAFADVGRALEAYQRRLIPAPAPFDRYVDAVASGDPSGGGHLSDGAVRGLRWFVGPGRCATCHDGPWLTDRAFHVLGVPTDHEAPPGGRAEGARRLLSDPFRCDGPHSGATDCPELRYLDPDRPGFEGALRTPTLRNVALTAPYFHAGQARTLEDVLAFYREQPGEPAVGERDALLAQVDPAIPVADVVDFLQALTSPPLDRALLGPPE